MLTRQIDARLRRIRLSILETFLMMLLAFARLVQADEGSPEEFSVGIRLAKESTSLRIRGAITADDPSAMISGVLEEGLVLATRETARGGPAGSATRPLWKIEFSGSQCRATGTRAVTCKAPDSGSRAILRLGARKPSRLTLKVTSFGLPETEAMPETSSLAVEINIGPQHRVDLTAACQSHSSDNAEQFLCKSKAAQDSLETPPGEDSRPSKGGSGSRAAQPSAPQEAATQTSGPDSSENSDSEPAFDQAPPSPGVGATLGSSPAEPLDPDSWAGTPAAGAHSDRRVTRRPSDPLRGQNQTPPFSDGLASGESSQAVQVDNHDRLLSVHTRGAPLWKVLSALAEISGIEIRVVGGTGAAREAVYLDLDQHRATEILSILLSHRNHLILGRGTSSPSIWVGAPTPSSSRPFWNTDIPEAPDAS